MSFYLIGGCLMKNGFTLAEVLITLGIIGVVAAMTMPTLIQKNQDKELISRIKKTYSDVSNAIIRAQTDYGVVGDNSALFDPNNTSIETAEKFVKYFNGAKLCKSKTDRGCAQYYYDIKYATTKVDAGSGQTVVDTANYPKIILNSGAVLAVYQYNNPDCYKMETANATDEYGRPIKNPDGTNQTITWKNTRCALIRMDVNGLKNPNQFGRDAFGLQVTKQRVAVEGWKFAGGDSLKNILSGKDEFVYTNYAKGDKVKF